MIRLTSLLTALFLLSSPPLARAQAGAGKPEPVGSRLFLQIRDHQLFLGQSPFRNVGATIPDLFERFLCADDIGANRALTDAQTAGMRCVRCAGLPRAAAAYRLFTSDRAGWLAAYDRMLAAANSHQIAIIPSLLYDSHALPQAAVANSTLTGAAARPTDVLTPGSPANDLAVAYVTAIVTRYRNDPRILFWEIGNEYNLLADRATATVSANLAAPSVSDRIRAFLGQMAALIHRIDRHHLVTSGNGEIPLYAALLPHRRLDNRYPSTPPDADSSQTFAQYQEMLDFFNPPGIDIISIHAHPPGDQKVDWLLEDDTHALRISWTQYACTVLGKPLFVGAFGQTTLTDGKEEPALWTLDFLKRMQYEAAPLAALQSWEPGPEAGAVSTQAISPGSTPQLAFAVKVVNATIVNSQAGNLALLTSPPLPVSAADRARALVNFLRALSALSAAP